MPQVILPLKLSCPFFILFWSNLSVGLQSPLNLNGFKLKFFKSAQEKQFSENKFVRAQNNFCIVNFDRERIRQFHFKGDVSYYNSRCGNVNDHVYFGFSNGSLTDIVKCPHFVPEQRWSFANFEQFDLADVQLFLRKFVQFTFWSDNAAVKIFQHKDTFYHYAQTNHHHIWDVTIEKIDFKSEIFPVPLFSNLTNRRNIDRLGPDHSGNFWYESAFYLLNNQQFKIENQSHKKKKYSSGSRRPTVLNVQMYGSEENFLSTKIYPNIPTNNQSKDLPVRDLDCRGVSWLTGLRPPHIAQVAWVGVWGSGNHMMKFLLEMVTGLKTVGGLVVQENGKYKTVQILILVDHFSDGSFLQFNHHTTALNRLRGLHRYSHAD